MQTTRRFDVVLWGATGFTGGLVAEYLARNYGADGQRLRWAIAGRSEQKLTQVRERLRAIDAAAEKLPLLLADSSDLPSLHALAKQARTVCSTVGPFSRYGSDLVAACVAERTHYCDITGEVQWVRRMIRAHHDTARSQGTRIVHTCGYDSVPSDLGVLVLEDHALKHFGAPCSDVKSRVLARKAGFSGGTFASMVNAFEEAQRDPSVQEVLEDPFSLCPDPNEPTGPREEQKGPRYDADLGAYTAPFIMAVANARVVYRSNALLGFRYGRDFHYNEVVTTGKGPGGALAASVVAGGMLGFQHAIKVGPVRELLVRKMPKPGEGPSARQREGAYFALQFIGRVNGHTARARFAANGDPGYGETSKMVAESAVCLALDQDKLPSEGGVLTPASAMGMTLVERLRRAGMAIDAWTE